jgi:hypothetical protein
MPHIAGHNLASQPEQALESGASARTLELCRRLDWRFLLPDPALHNVGYFGETSELLPALERFSESVTTFYGDIPGPVYPRFDTVVLRYPSLHIVEVAGRMTRPDGHMYIELGGALSHISTRNVMSQGLVGIMKYARLLWNLEFDDIHAYWHRPGFEGCREIVPLFDRAAMNYIISRERPGNLARGVSMMAVRCLLKTGLLPHMVPCYSAIAHKRQVLERSK